MVGEETRDFLGQGFALFLVAGLVGLVAWWAKDYAPEATPADGGASDAQADGPFVDSDAGAPDAAPRPEPAPDAEPAHILLAAVVEEVDGFEAEVGTGCILIATARGDALSRVQLRCPPLDYDSGELDGSVGEVSSEGDVRYTTPAGQGGRRLTVDSARGMATVLGSDDEGRGTARLRLATGPEPEEQAGAPCPPTTDFEGAALTATETLEPLSLRIGAEPRLDLFGASTATVTEINFDCDAETMAATGPDSSYEGRLGPRGATVTGTADLDGQPARFWLRARN